MKTKRNKTSTSKKTKKNKFKSFNINQLNSLNINSSNLKLLKNAISSNRVDLLFINRDIAQKINHTFNHKLNIKTKPTNQLLSGRCWIFAFLNMLRLDMIKHYQLKPSFEFSQNYLFFYDKLEKSLYFLQMIYKTRNQPIDSRLVSYFFNSMVNDGGNWNMFINLVNKYGLLPKNSMTDTLQSKFTKHLNFFLKENLKWMAINIRAAKTRAQSDRLTKTYIKHIYKLLVIFLGKPPKTFDWEFYENKTELKRSVKSLTPQMFRDNFVRFKSNDWLFICNFPNKEYPFFQEYNIEYCTNMIDGIKLTFINLPEKYLLDLTQKSLDNKQAVWFCSDFNHGISKKHNIMATDIMDFSPLYSKQLQSKQNMKAREIAYKIAKPEHATLIIGYNKKGNKINKWLVENSHGTNKITKGNLTMTTEWFKQYGYGVLIKKTFIDKKILDIQHKSTKNIKPWSIIGCEVMMVY